jgi:integrase/recombinase XerD
MVIQALCKFSDYLRQNGRLLLPKLDLRTEDNNSEVTDILTQLEIKQLFEVTYLLYEPKKSDKGIVYYEAMQLRDRAMLNVFYGCGMRRNEVVQHLRKINSRIKNFDQIRASVITAWLKQYDLRKVQYLSGHKYVSSTESYKANVIDELEDDITKFHPL